MSYKGKIPYQYDRNGKSWQQGAYKNQGSAMATAHDANVLAQRDTRYHQFVK